ncbi:hypothetical protein HYN56_14070 [Flavobacterium crocinum]|uniref:Uncharacterized protein n=1 Tax=Flavobacterium crocinum TaxID=2183896 RepID=A0A2S1YMI6_9FLAO|nr:hypothetical protein [Flavobacterium crocinum]AWK05300.1 hypothetical protein HYN56_14070 [Flavobacterium crocinum]
MNIKIIVVLALLVLAILNYKRILSFKDYIQEKRANEFKKRTNLDLSTLTRISARPVMILYGLEYFFLNRSVFYFDENYLYKITRKDPVVKHSLSKITEVRRTAVKINERRVWKIIINDAGKLIVYKMRSNYGSFDLFSERIKENPNAIVDDKRIWGIFE